MVKDFPTSRSGDVDTSLNTAADTCSPAEDTPNPKYYHRDSLKVRRTNGKELNQRL